VRISPSTPKLARISERFDMTGQEPSHFSEGPLVLEGHVPALRGWMRLARYHLL
jgi:hypothetical protein